MATAPWHVVGDGSGRATDRSCDHLAAVAPQDPTPPRSCVDCVAEGSDWVHLRQCLVCGDVRCCDSSPRRHATAHWHATAHAVMRSTEPGEDWGWCYPDELMLAPCDA